MKLITARANHGPVDNRGVIGHAWSPDLQAWELHPPLTDPGQRFAQIEVVHTARIDGQDLLMFSALAKDMSLERARGTTGGVWVAKADTPLGPYDIRRTAAHQQRPIRRPTHQRPTNRSDHVPRLPLRLPRRNLHRRDRRAANSSLGRQPPSASHPSRRN
jgi:hypothetical protein